MLQKNRFRQFARAAEFERAEILVPVAVWRVGLGSDPVLQDFKITQWNVTLCYRTLRGRLENRIFGNPILSEDGANQIPAGLVLLGWIFLFYEPEVRGF